MKAILNANEAVAHISYAFTDVAIIYPITPSSTMAEKVEELASYSKEVNAFGNPVEIVQMQSEAGVAGAMHGSLKTGTLTTTYSCSQGLLLMEPTLYKMVGELLPGVIHVSSRSLSTSALSIFGDHSDVMAIRQTGAMMISSANVQQAALFAAVSHECAIVASLPVIHFFDGFNTSHELRKITLPSKEKIEEVLDYDAVMHFRTQSLRNDFPTVSGSAMNPDIYFQQMEANNMLYSQLPALVENILEKYNPLFEVEQSIISYIGSKKAKIILVSMGSVFDTISQVVEELNQQDDEQPFAAMSIHLYRPFPKEKFLSLLPNEVEKIIVLDRTKENGSVSEPLLNDIQACCYEAQRFVSTIGGRYGLGSKETTPDQIRAIYIEGKKSHPKKKFTIGIHDDVSFLSLSGIGEKDLTNTKETSQIKVWGFGSDGAVSCNKQTAKIIGESCDLDVQAQFFFDSRKSGNVTISNIRLSKQPITSAYPISKPNIVLCYNDRYLKTYDILEGIQDNGLFLLNTSATDQMLASMIPDEMKDIILKRNIRCYKIPASKLARKYQLGPKINTIMQTCFLHLTNFIPFEEGISKLKEEIFVKYSKMSTDVVESNYSAMDEALEHLSHFKIEEIPKISPVSRWKPTKLTLNDMQQQVNRCHGNEITVGDIVRNQLMNGSFPTGNSKFEKRNSCHEFPEWDPSYCVQCNLCATVCPHAAIRPFLLEKDGIEDFETVPSKSHKEYDFRVQVSPLDCTGCTLCVQACPFQNRALKMVNDEEKKTKESQHWNEVLDKQQKVPLTFEKLSMRNLQYQQPLMEFPSACGGCGETGYLKILTQLFGSSMVIANATGCSSIYGCFSLTTPYTQNENGYGPVWATSLLENNAEYGYGMQIGTTVLQASIARKLESIKENQKFSQTLQQKIQQWLSAYESRAHYEKISQELINALVNEKMVHPILEEIYELRFLLAKRSQWIIGGDGWAYDIGYSGLDHVLSKHNDINILILDNEGYSNTGGQTSKATPKSSKTKFALNGNQSQKKDLATLLMQYGHVYVGQISLNANPEQTLKAMIEAEQYPGPSVLIAYSPCILHGNIHSNALVSSKHAVECGYWTLFRFHPLGKNHSPTFHLDSKEPKWDEYKTFMLSQWRYAANQENDNPNYEELMSASIAEAKKRYENYKLLKTKISKGV